MQIVNKTRNTTVAEKAIVAKRLFERIKGLLFKEGLKKGEALILLPCNSIHTLFMRFPIDVLFLDKFNRVIRKIPHLKPFRFTAIYWASKRVIELPIGAIQSSSTQEGDFISFID